jgi:hypothetical protein
MTLERASGLRVEDNPRLSVRTLLEIAALIRKELESIGCQCDILQSDQTKEDVHVSQATPAVIINRSAKPTPTFTSRRSEKKRRHHGADAPATDPQGAREEGGA